MTSDKNVQSRDARVFTIVGDSRNDFNDILRIRKGLSKADVIDVFRRIEFERRTMLAEIVLVTRAYR